MNGYRLVLTATLVALPITAKASGIEAMEVERARLVTVLLAPLASPDERAARLAEQARRLQAAEALVLAGAGKRPTAAARRAFEDFDSGFLVHAAAENGRTVVDQWFEEVGVSTATLRAARPIDR